MLHVVLVAALAAQADPGGGPDTAPVEDGAIPVSLAPEPPEPLIGFSEIASFASESAHIFLSGRPDDCGQPPLRDGFPHQRVVGNQRMMRTNAAPQSDNSKR